MRTGKLLRLGILGSLVAAGLSSTGCSSMNNTEKGAAIGAGTGAVLGTAVGAATGRPLVGAAIGTAAGTAGGALIGNDVDKQEHRAKEYQQAQAVAAAQAQQQRLGVFDVIRLSQSGMEDQLIINQIRSTGSTFQLTTSDLESLKANGVSAAVIAEMQVARATTVIPGRYVSPATGATVIYEQPVYPAPAVIVAPPRPYYGWGYYRRW
jgi:phage tail tape-measure protein